MDRILDSHKPLKTLEFYYFGDFKINAEARRLWHGDEPVPLTPKEFEVLLYLVENAGKVAEKNDILDAVWADTFVEESTLARNVSWLRKKLKKVSNGKNFIKTVPKRGYRFTAEVFRENKQDKNQIVVEEEIVEHLTFEETISTDDAELQNSGIEVYKTNVPGIANFSISDIFLSLKTLYLLIGLTAFIGLGFFAYQNYFDDNSINSGVYTAPRLVNLALGKATKQSSDGEKNRGLSYEAVDGNTHGGWFQSSISLTGDDQIGPVIVRGTTDPWWEVDLGDVYEIEQIKIYMRTDSTGYYLKDFKVLFRNDSNENFRPFVEGLYSYEDFRTNPMILKNKVNARFVRIQAYGSSKYVSLAEVEVMGIPKPGESANIPEKCYPKETRLTVFTEPNYQGECFVLDLKNYPSLESISNAGEKIYSLLVGEDIKAKVCPKLDFQGKCEEITARRSFEEPIRSIKMADYFQLKNEKNGCLEVDSLNVKNNFPVKIKPCDNNKNQQWFWTEWGQLRVGGDKCLDLTINDEVVVTQCKSKSLINDRVQRWIWTNLNEIRTATRNKTCLTVNKSEDSEDFPVRIKECEFTENQVWSFIE